MKKVMCFVAILALSATVFAGPISVTLTKSNETATTADITVGYTGASGDKPVGIALVVDITNGSLVAAPTNFGVDSFFDVFIDFAADDPAAYAAGADPATGVLAGAHPVAATDAAGTPTFPVSVFSLCMGELANVATVPAAIANLVTFTVTRTDPGQATVVCVATDPLRGDETAGSIVDSAAAYMTVTLPACATIDAVSVGCTCYGDIADDTGLTPGASGMVNFGDINYLAAQLAAAGWFIPTASRPELLCADMADSTGLTPGPDGNIDFGDLNYMAAQLSAAGWSIPCIPQ